MTERPPPNSPYAQIAAKPHYNGCSYCGYLDWTVEKYGRVTHKEGCPMRTDPWHQGDPHPETPDAAMPRRWHEGDRVRHYLTCEVGVVQSVGEESGSEQGRLVAVAWTSKKASVVREAELEPRNA